MAMLAEKNAAANALIERVGIETEKVNKEKEGAQVEEDAVAKITELVEASDGGFGAFLLFDHDWAPPAAKMHSYELFAQYVMPHFTGQLTAPAASCDWVTASGTEFVDRAAHAIGKAIDDHAAERGSRHAPR